MPRQFSPASRDAVLAEAEEDPDIHQACECGPGLMVTYRFDSSDSQLYTNLMEGYGWYVASVEPRETGDVVVLMPVGEVP